MPGRLRPAFLRYPSVCTRIWRRLNPLATPAIAHGGEQRYSGLVTFNGAVEGQVLFQPSGHVRPQVGDPVALLAANQQHHVLAPLGQILGLGAMRSEEHTSEL